MKKLFLSLAIVAATTFQLSAAEAKGYQVTGPVVAVTPTMIVVLKDDKKWEVAKDKATKGGDVKVGDKVTVYYTMTATEIEVKPVKAEKKADKK